MTKILRIENWDANTALGYRVNLNRYLQHNELKIPPEAAKELKQLLERDDMRLVGDEEFKETLTKIVESQHLLTWQLRCFILEHPISALLYFGIFCISIYGILKFNKKIKKTIYLFYKANETIVRNIIAALGYFFPYFEAARSFGGVVLAIYPQMKMVLPSYLMDFVEASTGKYQYVSVYYFFIVYLVCVRNHIPKARFIRFHWLYGLMVDQMFNFSLYIYNPINQMLSKRHLEDEMAFTGLLALLIFLYFIIPPIIRALTGRYIAHPFVRDAVEIHLGRDKDPGFKWWDRKK